jgi:hypothetical protein
MFFCYINILCFLALNGHIFFIIKFLRFYVVGCHVRPHWDAYDAWTFNLIYKVAARLTSWIDKFLNHAGCAALVKSVLIVMPIFLLTALMVDKATIKAFDKICRGMLWACKAVVTSGKCKVNWPKVCRPKDLGGMSILDLEWFVRALHLRWLWQEWTAPEKPRVGLGTRNDGTE